MISAIIVDDDYKNIRVLKALLAESCKQVVIIGEATGIDSASSLIATKKPDLVFLDIEMPYGTGFDLLDRLMPIDFEVIFITAYDNYAVKAFRYYALDYLLKPVDINELMVAVDKASKQLQSKQTNEKLRMYFEKLQAPQMDKISVPSLEGLTFIDIKKIIRCEAEANYTHIFLEGNQKITSSRNLKEFEELLPEGIFFRIHNSHLVNINFIKKYLRGRGGYVVLEDNTELEVAARRKEKFLSLFNRNDSLSKF